VNGGADPAMDGLREPDGRDGVRSPGGEQATAELLERIRRGDAAAFEAVAREHAPRLFRLALRLSGRREDAEDLVQETLVRALPRLGRFEGRARLSTYLVRALVNLWKNRLRSRKRSRIVAWVFGSREHGEATPEPADARPSPLEQLETAERAARVRTAVAQLEPTRRLTLLLREVEMLSYEEIAVMTGVPVGTVRSRIARARDELRRRLGDGP